MSFNKEKFAELLEKAKGNRSLNQYALKSGVSSAHISRLMRGLLDTPPNPETIKLLAEKAHNGVTYTDLMKAAGHIEENKQNAKEFIEDIDLELTDEEILEKYNLTVDGEKLSLEEAKEFINYVRVKRKLKK